MAQFYHVKIGDMWARIGHNIIEGAVLLLFSGIAYLLYDLNQKVSVVTTEVRIYNVHNEHRLSAVERDIAVCCKRP